MKYSVLHSLVCICCSAMLIASCAGTKLTRSQVGPAFQGAPVSNILVIAVTKQPENRRLFEQKFVVQLKQAGVDAVSSMKAVPMPSDLKLEKSAILAAVGKYGADAVIITHLKGKTEQEILTRSSYDGLGFYNNYGRIYNYAHDPGYARTQTDVQLETNLYDVETEKLLWSGQSTSMDIDSRKQVIDEVIQVVIRDLQKHGIIASK